MSKRNPRTHPAEKDVLHKTSPSGKSLSRTVLKVEPYAAGSMTRAYYVTYEDQNGKQKRIWCVTWESWSADAMVTTRGAA